MSPDDTRHPFLTKSVVEKANLPETVQAVTQLSLQSGNYSSTEKLSLASGGAIWQPATNQRPVSTRVND